MEGDIPMVHNRRTKRKSKNVDSHLLVTPAIFKPGSTVFKNLDSRLKISGMTAGGGGCLTKFQA